MSRPQMHLPGWIPIIVVALAGSLAAAQQRATAPPAASRPLFRDVARDAGVEFTHVNGASPAKHFPEIMGSGGLFFDYDQDGWLDIFLVDGGSIAEPPVAARARHRLYRNRGDGSFEDVTAASGITHGEYGMGACAGDVDSDGWPDLYVTAYGRNALYLNTGDGAFSDVSARSGADSDLWSTSCAFADLDRDGDLDLFVTNYVEMGDSRGQFCGDSGRGVRMYCHPLNFQPSRNLLYRNDGTGTFDDASEASGILPHRGNGLGVAITDYDDDGWPDVFVANDGMPNFLFRNEGDGRFTESALFAGVAVAADGRARAGMGTTFGDYNADGRLDLVVTNHETEMHSLFSNTGDGLFQDVTVPSGVGPATRRYVGFGVAFLDYDNDARLDLAIVNGHVIDNIAQLRAGARHAQRGLLLRNTDGRRFTDVGDRAGAAFAERQVGRALVKGDFDNDGRVDLLVTANGGAARLMRNETGAAGASLIVRLIGTASNRHAIGARLRLTAGGRTYVREVRAGSSYLGQHDLRLHVGLGGARTATRLEIRWPSGRTEVFDEVAGGDIVTIRESKGIEARTPFRR